MFIHLHTHSYFSLQEGLISPKKLVQTAAQYSMPALALTDHLYLSGSVEFYEACQEAGIKPILGLEIDLAYPPELSGIKSNASSGPLLLLAENFTGWSNLCKISSSLLMDSEKEQQRTCLLDGLSSHSEGLICLTGGQASLISRLTAIADIENASRLLGMLQDIFPDRLYVELQKHHPEDEALCYRLKDLAESFHLPFTATHDIYYLNPEDALLQRTLTAIRLNTPISRLSQSAAAPPAANFRSSQEMIRQFSAFPQAIQATEDINARCQLKLPLYEPHFPVVPVPEGMTALQVLRKKAEAGAVKHYGAISPELQERIEYEMQVIGERGFEPIFLIVEEILNFARKSGVPTSSRGSAASSLVAYCLGITTPDPIFHNLYFERFLNPARTNPPDIDTDICSRRRDKVIQHVFEVYGEDRVAMVGTINRFRPRSALGDTAKAHGLSPANVRALTAQIPNYFHYLHGEQSTDEVVNPFQDLISKNSNPTYLKIFQEASRLLDLPRHLSVHAGGLVISPGLMCDLIPVQRSGSKEIIITQFDLGSVERMGLVKIDLLGIRGLTVLGDVAESIQSWKRKEFPTALDVLEAIPEDDQETSSLVENARTIGCFQIESPGMRATLRDIRACNVDDIIRALALYRPGPLKGGLHSAYIRRHRGEEPIIHLHPGLKPVLDETYGVILYQEQVLRIAHDLAGMSMTEAELLRRAMSHFDPGEKMKSLREHFVQGSMEKSSVPRETAEQIWEMMAAFAGYGFPKAHAASYGLIAWRAAWCKAHFPAEFMAAVLANWGGYYSQRVYLSETRRIGLAVRPPHINHSNHNFKAAYPKGEPVLYMGLDQVRDLTHRTQERILQHRPFHTLESFLGKVNPRKQEAENLIRVGALSGLGNIPGLLLKLDNTHRRPGQLSLFETQENYEEEGWPLNERMEAQERILGISIDAHPLELFAQQITTAGAVTSLDAIGKPGERVRVAGIRQTSRRSRTSKGDWMAFLTLEDLEGILDVIIFPNVYNRYRAELAQSKPMLIEGTVEQNNEREEPVLIAEKIWILE